MGVVIVGRVVYFSLVQFKDDFICIFVLFSINFIFIIIDLGLFKFVGCGGFIFYIWGDNNLVGESGEYLGFIIEVNDGLMSNCFLVVEFDILISNIFGGDLSFVYIGLDVNGVKFDFMYDLCLGIFDCIVLVNWGDYFVKIVYDLFKEVLSVEFYLNIINLVVNWIVLKLFLEFIFQNYMYVGFIGSNGVFCN